MKRFGMDRRALGRAAALIALLVVSGCAGAVLDGRARVVDDLVATAKDSGAERCAPVELAMAESHLAFARQELTEGDSHRARQELEIAEVNAREAVRKSPRKLCEPPKPRDRDGDGIPDEQDKCPTEPEDFDGFQDADGCPDPDNDNDGIPDVDDKCPLEPEDLDGFQDADGCPDPDNDGDGIPDMQDKCPLDPEDFDGFQDADGCPDPDNDNDGIPDVDDKCPLEPEDRDGFEDADGCPDPDNDGDGVLDVDDMCPNMPANTPDGCPEYKNVVVTQKKIEIKQTIYFETNKATIKPVSFALLDEVATVLRDNAEIEVRIEGHTDDRGTEEFNLRLSEARAASVREYLLGKGVAAERMVSQGFGKTRPIAENRSAAGRAKNRRVEFVIVNR